jgi:hypothetical protein
MDWSSHPSGRIGFWTVAGSAAPASLGEFDLREHDGIGPAFGPGNRGARMQLYAFDADGLFVGGIPGPQGFAHIQPQAPPGFCRPIFTYQTYYLGEGAPPTGMTDWPGLLEPYRPMLVGLLEGKRAEEAAAVPPIEVAPGSDFCGWDTLTLTGRLDLVVPAD